MDKFLKIVGALALSIGFIFYRLFVLSKVWALTVVPLGAPSVGMMQVWGVSLFLSCATLDVSKKDQKLGEAVKLTAKSAAMISIGWLIAYLFFG